MPWHLLGVFAADLPYSTKESRLQKEFANFSEIVEGWSIEVEEGMLLVTAHQIDDVKRWLTAVEGSGFKAISCA
ncbi:hypothetical protein V6N13_033847 [Hibiscus sabdariffa]|uniref:Uncharacterized protein n=1 Tax=Hibiscus sabdariffa TaxID=183260 RepID=A0ABR2F9D2_9ROSI